MKLQQDSIQRWQDGKMAMIHIHQDENQFYYFGQTLIELEKDIDGIIALGADRKGNGKQCWKIPSSCNSCRLHKTHREQLCAKDV